MKLLLKLLDIDTYLHMPTIIQHGKLINVQVTKRKTLSGCHREGLRKSHRRIKQLYRVEVVVSHRGKFKQCNAVHVRNMNGGVYSINKLYNDV